MSSGIRTAPTAGKMRCCRWRNPSPCRGQDGVSATPSPAAPRARARTAAARSAPALRRRSGSILRRSSKMRVLHSTCCDSSSSLAASGVGMSCTLCSSEMSARILSASSFWRRVRRSMPFMTSVRSRLSRSNSAGKQQLGLLLALRRASGHELGDRLLGVLDRHAPRREPRHQVLDLRIVLPTPWRHRRAAGRPTSRRPKARGPWPARTASPDSAGRPRARPSRACRRASRRQRATRSHASPPGPPRRAISPRAGS